MPRPLPRLDRTRPFGVVSPVTPEGVAFEQNGYHFDVHGQCVESFLTDKQRERHFGDGVADDKVLIGSSILPAEIEIAANVTMALGVVVARAHKDSGLSVDEWNDLPQADREARLAATVEDFRAALNVKKGRAVQTVGTLDDKKPEAKVEPREPERFEPVDPPAEVKPAAAVDPAALSFQDWLDQTATGRQYRVTDVIAAIAKRYGVKPAGKTAAVRFLVDEQGFRPGKL